MNTIDAELLLTRLTPRTMALMIADIEEGPCTFEAEELVSLIHRNEGIIQELRLKEMEPA